MENNTPPPTAPVQPQAEPQMAQASVQNTPVMPAPSDTVHKSRFGLLFVILFILGVLFLGGTYLFVVSQKKISSAMPIVNKQAQIQKNVHQLEEEIPADDTDNIDGDFTQVDAEMKNL